MRYPLECNVGHEHFETLEFHNQGMCQEAGEKEGSNSISTEMERARLYRSIQPYAA